MEYRKPRMIYGLRRPGTIAIRYVGQTCDPPKRLRRHLQKPHLEPLAAWFEELRTAGECPEMIELATAVNYGVACAIERDWIASLSVLYGELLFNVFHRGDIIAVSEVERSARDCARHQRWERHREYCRRNRRRWAAARRLRQEQLQQRMYTHGGEAMLLSGWAKRLGVSRERMRQRVAQCKSHGVDLLEAFSTPAGETMPSFQNPAERYRLRIAERNSSMTKPEWFDGEVHVVRRGSDFDESISCETMRTVIQAEAVARGGKCRFRILSGCMMFEFQKAKQKKKTAAA